MVVGIALTRSANPPQAAWCNVFQSNSQPHSKRMAA